MRLKLALLLITMCTNTYSQIDQRATQKTKQLYDFLYNVSKTHGSSQKVLIGQQGAFNQGQGWQHTNWKSSKSLNSDMKTYGGMHPFVYGIDFNEVKGFNDKMIVNKIKDHHAQGGILTMSWHMESFVKDGRDYNGHPDGSAFDITASVVHTILPGGKNHNKFKAKLDSLVSFNKRLEGIPIILRPFHEHNGSWFWWGSNNCTKDQYIQLWKFTVDYLKSQGVHNFLYAYSPDGNRLSYMTRYPGDAYVDIMGIDKYFDLKYENVKTLRPTLKYWAKQVKDLAKRAQKHNKIAAVTEFGSKSMSQNSSYFKNFWTQYASAPLKINTQDLRGISYILIWRNDDKDKTHFFGPVKSHYLNNDFKEMRNQGMIKGLKS